MKQKLVILAAAALGLGMTAPASAQVQGVTDTEVVIGAHTDMSGIFAAFGAPSIKAANLYLDEINAKGGVHGRKIRFIVEDHAYQMPKASQAINKLINSDKVFAMVLALGTPMNLAAFKLQDPKKIANVVPLSAARQMLQDPVDYKFTAFSSYYDQIKVGIRYLSEKEGAKTVCSMYIPSDFGLEIKEGAEAQAKAQSLKYAAETTHKPDDADFVGSLTKLKDAGCEVVAIALGVRQAITAVATAKKIGWTNVKFLGSSAGFHTAIAQAPGGVTEGLYAVSGWADLVNRIETTPAVKEWVEKYKAAAGEFPGTGALLGRTGMETFVRGLEAAGKDLTPESFKKAMEGLAYDDPLSSNKLAYSASSHQGSNTNIISQVKGGNWSEIARVTAD
jgi:branched-chain amino acid transport system substrate-binding protein